MSTNELISFYELKTICNVLYDPLEESHIKQLEKLTLLLFENNEIKDWKSFGFQNSIPETDFRGGGLISLKNIIFFIENCDPEINKY